MRRTKFQTFQYQEVDRATITPAPYNPRIMDKDAEARLEANLRRVGLLTTLVWNQRTGHLLSGHARLAILDRMEGSTEYRLGVAVVDLDEARERALNVFLNNTFAQGDFDIDALAPLLTDRDTVEAMGWQPEELLLEFGARPELQALIATDAPPPATAQDTIGPHVMVVFRTNADKLKFLQHLDCNEDQRTMMADELLAYLEPAARWRPFDA